MPKSGHKKSAQYEAVHCRSFCMESTANIATIIDTAKRFLIFFTLFIVNLLVYKLLHRFIVFVIFDIFAEKFS